MNIEDFTPARNKRKSKLEREWWEFVKQWHLFFQVASASAVLFKVNKMQICIFLVKIFVWHLFVLWLSNMWCTWLLRHASVTTPVIDPSFYLHEVNGILEILIVPALIGPCGMMEQQTLFTKWLPEHWRLCFIDYLQYSVFRGQQYLPFSFLILQASLGQDESNRKVFFGNQQILCKILIFLVQEKSQICIQNDIWCQIYLPWPHWSNVLKRWNV